MIKWLRRHGWYGLLIGALVVFDAFVHPLGAGPDRLIHDPAIYRLHDASYMRGDWYTDMATRSHVYEFYGRLINLFWRLHLTEEVWRIILYIASLILLYYALMRIGRQFHRSWLTIPMVAVLHLLIATGVNQPSWLYGPFLQIDGGVAPRSIGVAASFLALAFLLEGRMTALAITLGLATLIHVSNSLIVFLMVMLVWLIQPLLQRQSSRAMIVNQIKTVLRLVAIYLLFGGWFALYVARSGHTDMPLTASKFIWTWIYLRAPYMDLVHITRYGWVHFVAHVVAIVGGWAFLRWRQPALRQAIDTIALVGLVSVGFFFVFYLFAFIRPWLPGFQFYSIRTVYFAYFVAYLFVALTTLEISRTILRWVVRLPHHLVQHGVDIVVVAAVLGGLLIAIKGAYTRPKVINWQTSWAWVQENTSFDPAQNGISSRRGLVRIATLDALANRPKPFLGPPDVRIGRYYLPNIASFKSFGFTEEGLAQWFERVNEVTGGWVEAQYQMGKVIPVRIGEVPWRDLYSQLAPEDVHRLAQTYHFDRFLTYDDLNYPFPVVARDASFTLYAID